jgi:pyrimidine-nucleoside phosphorylase
MHVPQWIERKRDGGELSPAEISTLIEQFTAGNVPDYQMAAFAMTVFFRGMTAAETAALTAAMRDSGRVFRWPANTPPKVDKHSTGGIGDKVSLILAPLLACEGFWVPMVSGRGLGITGGTLDKLEAIPGFEVQVSEAEGLRQLERIGVFMAGQTADFCPADKKLYALRDVTGTVPSPALIIASIMSKKLAESLDRLVLDVKFGSGAFMKTRAEAEALGAGLAAAGNENGVVTTLRLNPMDEPLGGTVGNALEVFESVETLQGRGPADLLETTLDLCATVSDRPAEVFARHLETGAAWERFVALVEAQKGDAGALERMLEVHAAPIIETLEAATAGRIVRFDAGTIGRASVQLGAGRQQSTDAVDFAVGFSDIRKVGEFVEKGAPLLKIHARTAEACARAREAVQNAIEIA